MRRGGVTIRQRCGDVLVPAALALAAWAVVTLLSGGFVVRLGPAVVASRSFFRPVAAALAAAAIARLLLGRDRFAARVASIAGSSSQRTTRVALALAVGAIVIAAAWNTRAVGGSDSSCYALQAEAFAGGHATVRSTIAPFAPADVPSSAFAPAGFLASPRAPREAVPICAAGLALFMAPLSIAGRDLVFLVVPIFAGIAVWCTYLLGARIGDGAGGACAALLLACSPIFIYQSVQPMSDVPATALWLAAFVAVLRPGFRAAVFAGVLASLAVLTRPNLALIVLPLLWLVARPEKGDSPLFRPALREEKGDSPLFRVAAFAAGGVPGAVLMLALNVMRYGAPTASGYGDTGTLFSSAHVMPNLARYPQWLLSTETPLLLLALAAPFGVWRDPARRRAVLAGLLSAALLLITYLAYTVFDDWWYIRFLLPALPVLLVCSVVVLFRFTAGWAPRIGRSIAIVACVLLAGWYLDATFARRGLELRALESRFPVTGRYAARAMPANAVVLSGQASGAVVFHGRRGILMWDQIPAEALDRLVDTFEAGGHPVFAALEDGEAQDFRRRFAGQRFGALDWPAAAQTMTRVRVRVYRLADRARFAEGARLDTEFVR